MSENRRRQSSSTLNSSRNTHSSFSRSNTIKSKASDYKSDFDDDNRSNRTLSVKNSPKANYL